jgi:hypothetical protein
VGVEIKRLKIRNVREEARTPRISKTTLRIDPTVVTATAESGLEEKRMGPIVIKLVRM